MKKQMNISGGKPSPADFIIDLLFMTEVGADLLLRKVRLSLNYTTLQLRISGFINTLLQKRKYCVLCNALILQLYVTAVDYTEATESSPVDGSA
jgi:hypothetical protein